MHQPPIGASPGIWNSICGWTGQQVNVVHDGAFWVFFFFFFFSCFVLKIYSDLALGMLNCCFMSG